MSIRSDGAERIVDWPMRPRSFLVGRGCSRKSLYVVEAAGSVVAIGRKVRWTASDAVPGGNARFPLGGLGRRPIPRRGHRLRAMPTSPRLLSTIARLHEAELDSRPVHRTNSVGPLGFGRSLAGPADKNPTPRFDGVQLLPPPRRRAILASASSILLRTPSDRIWLVLDCYPAPLRLEQARGVTKTLAHFKPASRRAGLGSTGHCSRRTATGNHLACSDRSLHRLHLWTIEPTNSSRGNSSDRYSGRSHPVRRHVCAREPDGDHVPGADLRGGQRVFNDASAIAT